MPVDQCSQKQVLVTIQENGIIRGPSGYIIARLNSSTEYDSEHLDPVETNKEDIRKYKL